MSPHELRTRRNRPPAARRAYAPVVLLWVVAGLLATAVIGVAVHKAWPVLFPPITKRAPLDPTCDISAAACTVRFADGGAVWLDIRPRGIPTAAPLSVAVRLIDLPRPQRVELDVVGVDMDMGYNRVSLMRSAEDPDVYTGQAMLAICVRERMTWEARVLLRLGDDTLAAPFRFDTSRRGSN